MRSRSKGGRSSASGSDRPAASEGIAQCPLAAEMTLTMPPTAELAESTQAAAELRGADPGDRGGYDDLSRTFQQIGRYLTQNPNDIAMQSINALADRCGVHASSLVRFAQSFGYSGFQGTAEHLSGAGSRLRRPGFESRINALKSGTRSCTSRAAPRAARRPRGARHRFPAGSASTDIGRADSPGPSTFWPRPRRSTSPANSGRRRSRSSCATC